MYSKKKRSKVRLPVLSVLHGRFVAVLISVFHILDQPSPHEQAIASVKEALMTVSSEAEKESALLSSVSQLTSTLRFEKKVRSLFFACYPVIVCY